MYIFAGYFPTGIFRVFRWFWSQFRDISLNIFLGRSVLKEPEENLEISFNQKLASDGN
jgi:hypothetical protein